MLPSGEWLKNSRNCLGKVCILEGNEFISPLHQACKDTIRDFKKAKTKPKLAYQFFPKLLLMSLNNFKESLIERHRKCFHRKKYKDTQSCIA
jgi:hypothetical protein